MTETDDPTLAGGAVDRLLEMSPRATMTSITRLSAPSFLRRSALDPLEAAYKEAGHWGELCELYLQRLEGATTDAERAKLLRRVGTILCEQLDDAPQALEAFTEALVHEPDDEPTVIALEAIADALEAWEALVRAVAARLDEDPGGARDLALCDHLVRWTKRYLGRPEEAERFLLRIRAIDPAHSAIHARRASVYREQGEFHEQREELERALLGARMSEERRLLHLALADLKENRFGDVAGALGHLESALVIDPKGMDTLHALERLYQARERYSDVIGVLERQIKAAQSDEARVASLTRLATVHETIFVKPERAAVRLEEALAIQPSNAETLLALERCYQATRAWRDLVRVMEAQAGLAKPEGRAAKLAEAAEVLETKLDDAAGALAAYRRICTFDTRNTQALSSVLRLCERTGDWEGAVACRLRLIELTPAPEAKARLHVAVGETLTLHLDDARRARGHFERATSLDPKCSAAWEALARDARKEGAIDRLATFLERRVALTEAPRLKAQLLVELADARAALGDRAAAATADEEAIAIDPGNEVAADRMLLRYTTAERWAEALPLCERLVNAAVRDGDHERAFTLQRSFTRAALALGEPARALVSALGAYTSKQVPEAREDLVEVCHLGRTDAALLGRARTALEAIIADHAELSTPALARLGDIAAALGSPQTADALYSDALARDQQFVPALEGLARLAVEGQDWEEAGTLKHCLADASTERAERFDLLVEAGEILAHRARRLDLAAPALEEARTIRPRDHLLLHTLVWIYTELEAWENLVEVLRSVADSEADPDRRAKGVYAMALVLRDKVGDAVRAASAFEKALDLDPSRLDAFERIVRIHTERREWQPLAKAYDRMLQRIPAEGEVDLRHALLSQLGLVHRDRLHDAVKATQAFRAASQLKPADDETRAILSELLVLTNQTDDAIQAVRTAIALRPEDAAVCRELFDLSMRQSAFDLGWRSLDALRVAGGVMTAEQERFYQDYDVHPLFAAQIALASAGWKELLHPDLDPALTRILGFATRAILRSPRARANREQAARALGPTLAASDAPAARVLSAVRAGAAVLGVDPPLLYGRKGASALEPVGKAPGLFVSVDACSALPDAALSFLVGKRLAEHRPEVAARVILPTLAELTALVGAAARVVGVDGEPCVFDQVLQATLSADEKEAIRAALATAHAKGRARFDVARWRALADASASRAGLLLAGHLDAALRGLIQSPQAPGDLPAREQLNQLVVFSLGDTYGALREQLGAAVHA